MVLLYADEAGRNPGRKWEFIRQKQGVYADVARLERPLQIIGPFAPIIWSERSNYLAQALKPLKITLIGFQAFIHLCCKVKHYF